VNHPTGASASSAARGPLVVSPVNPRYFAVAGDDREVVYLTGSLFEGFSLHLTATPDNVAGHPFHASNNVNGIEITSIVDYQVLPVDPRVEALQMAYLHKVVDTVHDLPNVLYEVANESSGQDADVVRMPDGTTIETPIGDSTAWQYWVIDTIRRYERDKGYTPHPVGMTFLYPVPDQTRANDPPWASPADWISPGFDDGPMPRDSRWRHDPPAGDGTKVVLSDTDHYAHGQRRAVGVEVVPSRPQPIPVRLGHRQWRASGGPARGGSVLRVPRTSALRAG
jgi:hypothetical protein